MRRRVARRLDHPPGAEVGLHLDALDEVARGLQRAAHPGVRAALALRPGAQRRLRDAAGARDLDLPQQRRRGVAGPCGEVLVARVDPELAAGARLQRGGLAAVVDVGVRADDQADVLDLPADLLQGALEVAHRPAAAEAAVEQHDAVAGGDRPGVAVRHAGPGQRDAQPPDAGEHPLAAPDLGPSRGLAHGAGRYRRAHARRRTVRCDDVLRRPDGARRGRRGGVLGARRGRQHDRPDEPRRPGRRPRLLRRPVRRVPRLRVRRRVRHRGGRPRGGALERDRHVLGPGLVPGHRADRAARDADRPGPAAGPRRADRAQRRVHRRPRPRAPARPACRRRARAPTPPCSARST